jgi:hypothetical protein
MRRADQERRPGRGVASRLRPLALLACAGLAGGCSLLSLDVLDSGSGGGGPSSVASGAAGAGGGDAITGTTAQTSTGEGASTSTGTSGGGPGGGGGEGGAATGTGGAGGGSGGGVPCGGPSLLADEFDDDEVTWPYWSDDDDDADIDIDAGVLSLSPKPDGTNPWVSFFSRYRYDLRGDAFSARVLSVLDPSLDTASSSMLVLDGTSDDYVAIRAAEGNIQVVTWLSDDFTTRVEEPFDPIAQRNWRLRHEGTSVVAETSPDGGPWTTLDTIDASLLFDLGQIQVALLARLEESTTDPGSFSIDAIAGLAADATYCPPSAFTDDFEDGVRSPEWDRAVAHPECGPVEDGDLRFPFEAGTSEYCSYRTSHLFDLRGEGVMVRVIARPTAGATAEGYLQVRDRADSGALIIAGGTQITAQKQEEGNGIALRSEPWDHEVEPWWRIRDDDGMIRFEVSEDTLEWRQVTEAAVWFDSSAVEVGLVGGTWNDPADPGVVGFDDYNLPP